MTDRASFLYDVRCTTCNRRIAVSGAQKWGLYCDEFCAQDLPASDQEMRDSVIEAAARDTDVPMTKVAARFGLTRQRVYQVLDTRDLRKEVKA